VEYPDHWLREGNPWELERPELTKRVKFYGHTEFYINDRGRKCARWSGTNDVLAVPYDVPIPGYGNGVVNTLRLWRAAATDEFDLEEFNAGDYTEAVAAKNRAEQITMVLYPNDASENGKELRLRQQYFLASASLQDVLADWVHFHGENFGEFANKHVFQLNDTHPTLAVAELMRLLLDDYLLEWDVAWRITTSTMAYTNHTLLPEALEKWPVRLMRELLPRLLDIIYEINARFLAEVALRWPGDTQRQQRMSLIEEGNDPHVRMAYLGIVGSFSVNGVAALHSNLLKRGLFKDFFELWPEKFNNKTNGVTPRRWLAHSNRKLAELITEAVGDGWQTDLEKISHLKDFVNDSAFCERWFQIKQHNKAALAELVHRECGVCFDTGHMFDVQVKRIHEYKRQLLNVLHIIHLYDRIKRGDAVKMKPRCVLIGGKAAPGYAMAKLIIKLINNVAAVINADTSVKHLLQVVFLPNYRVSSMEIICPGTDLSEQISTAGKEASGTGNMKFMMNGAVTIGTYDGANIEILEAAGGENFFLFGLRVEDIPAYRAAHKPNQIIEHDEDLKRVMQLLECGHFSLFEPGIFDPIVAAIRRDDDPWMVAADFRSYVEAQRKAAEMYQDRAAWTRMSILNAAASGRFSSDRTIREYARDIWQII
jgi:starch phosphorylase